MPPKEKHQWVREDTEFEWWQHDESGEEFKVKRTGIGEHELELHKGRTYLPTSPASGAPRRTNQPIRAGVRCRDARALGRRSRTAGMPRIRGDITQKAY